MDNNQSILLIYFLLNTYILISIFLYALNNVLWKKNLQNCSVPFLVAYRALFTSVASIIIIYLIYGLNVYVNQPLGKIFVGSLFGVLGLFLMLNVIKIAPLQWLGIYNLVGIVFTSIYLFYIENITIIDSLLGILLILVGFIFYLYHNKEKEKKISLYQHFFLLGMTICYSISSLIHWKNLDNKVPTLVIISIQEFVVFISATVIAIATLKIANMKFDLKKYFSATVTMAAIIFLALLFSLLGLKAVNPLISSILFLATPLLTIFFGNFFFKEKIGYYNIIAIIFIATGAFVLNYQNQ